MTTTVQAQDTAIKYTTVSTNTNQESWTADSTLCSTTRTLTSRIGDYLTFTFTGTGVSVYGTKGAKGGLINFSLDGGPAVQVDRSDKDTACDFNLFTQNGLINTQHVLTATFAAEQPDISNPSVMDSVLSIQRITYINPGGVTSNSAFSSPTPSAYVSRSPKSGVPIGPIIGGAVGGILLIALAFGVWLVLRRRRRSSHPQLHLDAEPPQTHYPPAGFVSPPGGSRPQSQMVYAPTLPSSAPFTPNSQSALMVHNDYNHPESSSGSDSKYTRESTPLTMTTNPDPKRTSAVNEPVVAGGVDLDELVPPPAYDEAGPSSGATGVRGVNEKRGSRPLPTRPS